MRILSPNALVGLIALSIPPREGPTASNPVTEYKAPEFRLRCTGCEREVTTFDLERLSKLINDYVAMPAIPGAA